LRDDLPRVDKIIHYETCDQDAIEIKGALVASKCRKRLELCWETASY
jgi:hypothetical protein